MKISITNIPDVTKANVESAKIVLADNIVRNVYPLFDEVFHTKVHQVDKLEQKLAERRNLVVEAKGRIEESMKTYKRKQQVSKLLQRVDKLTAAGLVYDGNLKHEMTVLLKIIDTLPEEKIKQHLHNTFQIINKRFSR